MNHFGVIDNLPLCLCMKGKYMMLFMMIFGPRQPGNDINVYLNLLIEDLSSYGMMRLKCLRGLPMNLFICMQC